MGMRITKVLGWGFPDWEGKADERTNYKAIYNRHEKEGYARNDAFIAAEEAKPYSFITQYRDIQLVKDKSYTDHLPSCVYASSEDEYLIMRPIFHSSFDRYADAIDYAEESLLPPEQQFRTRIGVLNDNPFPWNGTFCDARKQNRYVEPEATIARAVSYKISQDGMEGFLTPEPSTEVIIRSLGFETPEEFELYFQPRIPDELATQMQFSEMFTKLDEYGGIPSYYFCQPMLVTFLS